MSYNTSPEMRDLQNDVEKLQEDLVDKVFRHVMKDSFSCAAKCCINASGKKRNSCTENCMQKMPVMQNIVKNEMQTFQQRLQRCQMNCNEEIQDRVPVGDMSKLSDSAKEELQQQMMDCANSCFVQFRKKVPALYGRIESQVKSLHN